MLLVEKALDKAVVRPTISTTHPDYPELFTALPTKSTGSALAAPAPGSRSGANGPAEDGAACSKRKGCEMSGAPTLS
jgi:hypothetical protein